MDNSQVVNHLNSAGVIAYPTETVWGLGVDASSSQALQQIRKIKGRDADKPMSVLVANTDMAAEIVHTDRSIRRVMELVWPGPITLVMSVLPAYSKMARDLGSADGFIGLRCSPYPVVSSIIASYAKPIVTTSANQSGQPPAKDESELAWLPKEVLVVSDETGLSKGQLPSTVVKVDPDHNFSVLREGVVSKQFISDQLGSFLNQ